MEDTGPYGSFCRLCDWSHHHVDLVPELISNLLCRLFWPLPHHSATRILAALLWPGRHTGSRGASEEEGPGGFWSTGCICCMVATTA